MWDFRKHATEYALFFGSMAFLYFELTPIDNTYGGVFLFGVASALGAIVGVVLRPYLLRDREADPFWERFEASAAVVLGMAFLVGTTANFVNRTFPTGPESSTEVWYLWKGENKGEYYLFIEFPIGEERIQVSGAFWNTLPERGAVKLWYLPGRLGFPYIVRYELAP